MARKRPSTHSDEQFALFIDHMKEAHGGQAGAEFDDAVRRLIGVVRKGHPDVALEESEDVQGHDQSPPPHETTVGTLPNPPDFDAIEAAARETGASRADLMVLIGQLVFGSSNNESLLIYVLMLLLRSDEPSAAVVFSTLNTTRARLDLISRLAAIRIADREMREELDQVVKLFGEASQVRNEFLQAMYTVDAKGAITHTQTMHLVTKGGRIRFGEQNPIDQKRLDGMVEACRELRSLNRRVWELLPRLRDAMANSNSAGIPTESGI